MNGIVKGRKACMTATKAAELADISYPVYLEREKNPESFRLEEIKGVYQGADADGKQLIWQGILDLLTA